MLLEFCEIVLKHGLSKDYEALLSLNFLFNVLHCVRVLELGMDVHIDSDGMWDVVLA